mmetsp:Transcript_8014/g.21039  ORF Transcript_8014/g.21039 Transcript_8014/m.21039 type:complete len:428 (+) Transcript_8014:224-1507(+)
MGRGKKKKEKNPLSRLPPTPSLLIKSKLQNAGVDAITTQHNGPIPSSARANEETELRRKKDSTVKDPLRRARGLQNKSNICFLNAVLQALASCTTLSRKVADIKTAILEFHPITRELQALLAGLLDTHSQKPLDATPLLREIDENRHSGKFGDGRQHDAHELLLAIISLLSAEEKVLFPSLEESGADTSRTPSALFGFGTDTFIQCKVCNRVSKTSSSGCPISLLLPGVRKKSQALPERRESKVPLVGELLQSADARGCTDLDRSLEEFFACEVLPAMYRCPGCEKLCNQSNELCDSCATESDLIGKSVAYSDDGTGEDKTIVNEQVRSVRQDAKKQTFVRYCSDALIFHFNRFKRIGRSICKSSERISFPFSLDMNKYTLHRDNVASTKYRLVAVVTHSGDMKRGHYAAYVQRVQDHRNTSWYFVR